jgi:ATP-dependent RNA helicase DDX58
VGLTASVGVGKAKSMDEAVEWIRKLMANLDAEEMCTVREHIDELNKYQHRPDESKPV